MSKTWRRENRIRHKRLRERKHNGGKVFSQLDALGIPAKVFENEIAAIREYGNER
jgi:hypothetical protein